MAEAALGGLVKALLVQIASPAIKEFKLLRGHEKELKKLEDTVNTIKNVLEDAERRRPTDSAVQGWLARLKDVLYDADDLFDHVSYMVLHEKANTRSNITKEVSRLLLKPYHLSKHSQKVKAIRERLDDIAGDVSMFGLLMSRSQTDQDQPYRVQREQTHSYFPSSQVVGRDREREDIAKLLLPDNFEGKRGVSVVAVIGMGGLGKTTLGQYVYSDERVKQGFDMCMWCCVNYFSDLKVALEAIIKSATGGAAPERLDVDQLQSLLRKTVDGKRFLLVLDDVWDEDALNWRKLQVLLDYGKGGSVILATTRSVNVAQSMRATKPYYHLQGLSDESAWVLFKQTAFGEESEEQNCRDLEELGRQIFKKCGNAPLAILIIAGLLRHKEKKKWFPLVNGELSEVVPDEHGRVMQVLKMSYNELSSSIKRCFAYCSLFPKDHRLEKGKLVGMWIAQGFVEDCAAGQSLEDAAEDYFRCLVNRCFVQESTGIIGECYFKMHDLVYDLASEVAGSESIIVDESGSKFGDNTMRHVSLKHAFADASIEQLSSVYQSKSLRTLLFYHKNGICKINNLDKLISCFKSVRVLDLSFISIKKMPESVGQLIHLRYLDLTWSGLEMLPSSICMLHLLECLILRECGYLKELPHELGKLVSLRLLQIEGCLKLSQMAAGLANLTSLVTLDCLIVHNLGGGLRYLECLDSLSGSLTIELPRTVWMNAAIDAQKACLSKKHRLQKLCIQWKSEMLEVANTVMNALQPHSNLECLHILGFGGEKMPRWISEIRNLVSLTITNCNRCAELPLIKHLQFLKELYIQGMSSLVVMEEDGIGSMSDNLDSIFFPSLEALYICEMSSLTSWWKQSPSIRPAFHRVTKVTIRKCPKLTACLPLFPQVEDLVLCDIQAMPFWQAIGSDGSRLKTLRLESIHGLRSLIGAHIKHLSALQILSIRKQRDFEVSFISGLAYLTSLEKLEILECERLAWIDYDGDTKRSEMAGVQLPILRILEIPAVDRNVLYKHLKYLTSLEVLRVDTFNEELLHPKEEAEEEVWKSLQKLHRIRLGCSFDGRFARHLPRGVEFLTSLQELTIHGCEEVYLSWGVILGLHHLQILKISSVGKVIDVCSAALQMQPKSPLQHLEIYYTSEEWVEGIPWSSFPALLDLRLGHITSLEVLPEGLRHLTSLENLKLRGCKSVASFPCWMTRLSSLRSLDISGCSEELKERCKRTTGEDWPNIQCIPHITIEYEGI